MNSDVYGQYSAFRSRREDSYQVSLEIKRRDNALPGSGLDWYSKKFADCVLDDEDGECATNSTELAFSRSVAYFCGQHADCLVPGSRWALQRAKYVVEFEYSVVGVLEDMHRTLNVLEHYVPRFFSGASRLYFKQGKQPTQGGKSVHELFDFEPNHILEICLMIPGQIGSSRWRLEG